MNTFHLPQLDKKATQAFLKLVKLLPGELQHIKIDNTEETFMPVSFEFLFNVQFGPVQAKVYALAHFYKQNGDLVPDPDMQFMQFQQKGEDVILPMTYQDAMRFDECLFQENIKWKVLKKKMHSMVSFANIWLKNIEDQQGL
jgi:hypothetical protein